MMPWSHVAVGYVAYSLFVHAGYRDSPSSRETVVVLFAALLPDLIDKPLAWQFGLLEGGRTLAHSIFLGLPLSIVVLFLGYSRGRPRVGWAFVVGYLMHLAGDVFPPVLNGEGPEFGIVLWPVTAGGGGQGESFYAEFMENFVPYIQWLVGEIVSGAPSSELLVLLGIWGLTVLLWVYDGMPVVRDSYRWLRNLAG